MQPQGDKMNSLARSSASLYGNKEELYDRLRRHAYQGKKGELYLMLRRHAYQGKKVNYIYSS